MTSFWIDAPTMRGAPCFWITVQDNRVTEAPPYARWAIGRPVWGVLSWFQKRGARIQRCEPEIHEIKAREVLP